MFLRSFSFYFASNENIAAVMPTRHVCFVCHSQQKTLDGYVGFANLPNQVYRKSVKKGFEFTLMIVGESSLPFSVFFANAFPKSK